MPRLLRPLRLGAALLALLIATTSAHAITFNADPELMKFDALLTRARVAAVLTVDKVQYRWLGTRLVTDYTCRVTSAGYGADEGELVTITQPGGYWGDIGQKVMGLETFMPADRLAVLLGDAGYLSGGRPVIGMTLGAWRLVDSAAVDTEAAIDTPLQPLLVVESALRDAVAAPHTVGEFLQRARAAR